MLKKNNNKKCIPCVWLGWDTVLDRAFSDYYNIIRKTFWLFALESLICSIICKMNKTSIKIIKSVFLSAVLSLVHANAKCNNLRAEYDNLLDNADENDKNIVRISKQRVYNNVLKIGLRGKAQIMADLCQRFIGEYQ